MSVESTQDFVIEESVAQSMYSPATDEEAEAALAQCVDALSLIPYIELETYELQDNHRERLAIRCRMRTDRFSLDMVALDVVTVWNALVVGDNTPLKKLIDTEGGFDLKFAILYRSSTYITGRISIEPPLREKIRSPWSSRISAK